jgi:hypothetical protein
MHESKSIMEYRNCVHYTNSIIISAVTTLKTLQTLRLYNLQFLAFNFLQPPQIRLLHCIGHNCYRLRIQEAHKAP